MRFRTVGAALIALALLPAPAEARQHLTKREARAHALAFVADFVDLTDVNRTVGTRMVPPRKCRRISHVTVVCRFTFEHQGETIHGRVRIHRQRDGLLGFRVTPDLSDYWV